MHRNRGFTLIEILVVMTISIILVGLVLYPVYQSFWMTRQAQAMIDAQDAARAGMEQISRDLGEAMFVFDNSVVPVAIINATSPNFHNGEQGPIQLPVRQPGSGGTSIEWFTLPSAKLDFILPKITMHCENPQHPANEPRDYPRRRAGEPDDEAWPPCPVCTRDGLVATDVTAKPNMPLTQDTTIVRYFLGLRYNDPQYMDMPPAGLPKGEGLFGWKSPWIGEVEEGTENQVLLYRVEFDPHDDTLFPAAMSIQDRLKDPIFFYRPETCREWMKRARVIGIGKYQDLVVGTFDDNEVCTDVEPSITFKFQAVNNDTFAGAWSNDRNFEYPNAVPSVYTGAYGHWIDNHVDPATSPNLDDQSIYNWAITIYRDNNTLCYYTRFNSNGEMVVQKRVLNGDQWGNPQTTFNITRYLENGDIGPDTEMALIPNLSRGQVSFAIRPPSSRDAPPGYVCSLDCALINKAFHDRFVTDRSGARRSATLLQPPIAAVDLRYARIVPGSERVVGPDMYSRAGQPVRYERVPLTVGNPGLNQYTIDYDTGDIDFSRDYGHDLPNDRNIWVDYRVQFNRDGDIIKGDYTTKSLVTVRMAIRMHDPESSKAHVVDLTNSIKVRNAQR